MIRLLVLGAVLLTAVAPAQTLSAARTTPNLVDNIDRPLRYRPDGDDFVIEKGGESFNRPLYGGNTAFRVDGGDRPEFVLYLPGRGGNLRLGFRRADGDAKWLQAARHVTTRYRPGALLYEIRDPWLGDNGVLRIAALAYAQTEGLLLRVEAESTPAGIELLWAFGGINGQRGRRDGDIGTENVPIAQWFQLQPEFCRDNVIEPAADGGSATVRAKAATIFCLVPPGGQIRVADAAQWADARALFAPGSTATPATPVVIGSLVLPTGRPGYFSWQRLPTAGTAGAGDLSTYREVTAASPASDRRPAALRLLPAFTREELPRRWTEAEQHFAALRSRVRIESPDPFLNAAVGALNVAADAVWDEPDQAIMHGAIAWRTKLLGWRGPYVLDALGWHDRARQHFTYWAGRQNVKPIPERLPPADENANLARNETGLHSHGDLSNSHYDMNLVYIDALFRHLRWSGDLDFARQMWPVIARHLAWEQRLFRREFGPDKLPLYEAYAAIWASDDLQYHGGGVTHASAYNFFHHQEAARLARLLGIDATPYQREAQLLERGLRTHLWLPDRGHFAEYKDLLGLQRVHPSAGLWTFYHTIDSEVPTAQEAWLMCRQVAREIPHLPVRGPGVPPGLHTLATTNWLPYDWSINNVVLAEAVHAALAYWQAGQPEPAWSVLQGSLVAAMFMGISPGNVGSMSYLDVYRRESQRDFADGSGVLSRALLEGLVGVKPDALAGELRLEPGWPSDWPHLRLTHPDVRLAFTHHAGVDTFRVEQIRARPLPVRLRLRARSDDIESVTVDGTAARWLRVESAIGTPRVDLLLGAGRSHEIVVRWRGAPLPPVSEDPAAAVRFVPASQGEMRWLQPVPTTRETPAPAPAPAVDLRRATFAPVELARHYNDRVTQIFKNEYRTPRSPYVSLALPKQGLGGWAGGVNTTAEIDDTGLRGVAARHGGRLALPGGGWFVLPTAPEEKNAIFTSQWDNYPREAQVPLAGRARGVLLLMAGSTNHMQSRLANGEVVVAYADGTHATLVLENPTNWWTIEEDYFFDDFQFRVDPATRLPPRVNLKTGEVRVLELASFKGRGGKIPGGAATVLDLPLDPQRELRSLTVRTLANEVVIGLLAATLVQ